MPPGCEPLCVRRFARASRPGDQALGGLAPVRLHEEVRPHRYFPDVSKHTVDRLMRDEGMNGLVRGRSAKTTVPCRPRPA